MRVAQINFDQHSELINDYVLVMEREMPKFCSFTTLRTIDEAKAAISDHHLDILHCHGCWNAPTARLLLLAQKKGIRTVVSPHSQLEPWIIRKNYTREKFLKIRLWQKKALRQAYCIIAAGKLETAGLKEIGWNKRIETVRNTVITGTISPQGMARAITAVYRKILDSDTLALMSADTLLTMRLLIKAGIAGDKRWIKITPPILDDEGWRQIFIFAYHENLSDIILNGINIMRMKYSNIEPENIPCYLPEKYERPKRMSKIINYEADETEYILSILRVLHREDFHSRLRLLHLVELSKEMRTKMYDESRLIEEMKSRRQSRFLRRLTSLLTEWTGLEEGFSPVAPLSDHQTVNMGKEITSHLRII